jgi:hypothetical protein
VQEGRKAQNAARPEKRMARLPGRDLRPSGACLILMEVASLIGADTDSERAIRWLIALMVLRCDPLAIALTAAASARRN